jgi:hypothetical protein
MKGCILRLFAWKVRDAEISQLKGASEIDTPGMVVRTRLRLR